MRGRASTRFNKTGNLITGDFSIRHQSIFFKSCFKFELWLGREVCRTGYNICWESSRNIVDEDL